MAIDISIASQVSQTITNGVTTTAPSEDAVFDALETRSTFDEFISGQWNMPPIVSVTNGGGYNAQIYFSPFLIRRKTTLTEIGALVAIGTTGGTLKVGIYNSLNAAPNALLYESGLLDGTSGGLKSELITPNLVLQPGLYFRAIQTSVSGVNMRIGTIVGLIANTANVVNHSVYLQTNTYGTFPATASATFTNAVNTVYVFLKPL